jgi:hypothetical protein
MLGRFTIRSHKSGARTRKPDSDVLQKVAQISSGPRPSSKSRSRGMSTLTGSVYGWLSEQTEDQWASIEGAS